MAEIQNLKISNVESVEIVLDGTRKQFYLSQVQELLKGKKLVDFEILGNVGGQFSKTADTLFSPSGNVLAGDALVNSFITLNVKGKEVVKNMSLLYFTKQLFLGYLKPSFNNLEVDWAKSYIYLSGSVGVAGTSILLTIYFND